MEVKNYFSNKVVPYLNPYTEDDTLEKIMNIIIQDGFKLAQKRKPVLRLDMTLRMWQDFYQIRFFIFSSKKE